jgi:hypothetical protein
MFTTAGGKPPPPPEFENIKNKNSNINKGRENKVSS